MATTEKSRAKAGSSTESAEGLSDFLGLVGKQFSPGAESASREASRAVFELGRQAIEYGDILKDDDVELIDKIEETIKQIDEKLSTQINEILHHDDFQSLEGAWRGLEHLVSNTETDEKLKIRFMNVSKAEIAKELKKYKGVSWDQSPLFKKIYEAEYGVLGGEPYGALIGDYQFDHSPADVNILKGIAKISAAAHAPFIASAGPGLLQMESWQSLSNPRDVTKLMSTPDYAAWNSFRESDDSKYVGLTLPRFLSRLPYGAATDPVEEFDFEEKVDGENADNFTWSNAAYAMGVNINRAFKEYGWCTRIRGVESGGSVDGLPVYAFPTDDGGTDIKCPTEIGISDRREAELSKNGLLPLVHRKNTDIAAFIGAQSVNKPKEYSDPDATRSAALSARLPYLFSSSRFAHYLKCIVRDKVGSSQFSTAAEMERWLQDWIMQYVLGDPDNASEETKAQYPLADAKVEVHEVEGSPGYYTSKFHLQPHYQLEGLTVSLSLVSKLPSGQKD